MTAPTRPDETQGGQLSAAQLAELVALVDAQAAVRRKITDMARSAARSAFAGFTSWWDTAKVDKAIADVLKIVQPAQRQMARVTDAYIARAGSVMTGRTVRPAGAVDITRLRRAITDEVARELVDGKVTPAYILLGQFDPGGGRVDRADSIDTAVKLAVPDPASSKIAGAAEPSDPYGRVADQVRYHVVAEGATEEQARRQALVRIESAAATDVTLAVRQQYLRSVTRIPGITGYRRIVRPELTATGPCGLCVVAADRLYHVEDLHPIHGNCVCEVLPVIGAVDPGLGLNVGDLRRLYQAAGGTGGKGLKRIRVALAEHGELGSTLVDADQHYRGPVDVARAVHPDRAVRDRAKLAAFEGRLAVLLRRQAGGEDGLDRAIEWQSARIEQLRGGAAGEPRAGAQRTGSTSRRRTATVVPVS